MRAFVIIVIAVVLGLFFLIEGSLTTEPEFKVGDIVEIEEPAISCFTGQADLLTAIPMARQDWPDYLKGSCGVLDSLDNSTPYEVVKVAAGAGDYAHVYCVNPVQKTNQSCRWAAFPLGKTHLSTRP